MHDYETLVGELLKNRPELSREELDLRIRQKKEVVGAGYLTDQGALFLVAGELGVSLQQSPPSADMSINDLYIGANDITVVARVLAVYPPATYRRKKDGVEGAYRRLTLFDGRQTVRLTVWDEQAGQAEKMGIMMGAPVRVVSSYVKQGLDGKPNLNLGKRGRLEVLADTDVASKLEPLEKVTEKLTRISEEKQYVAVSCVVDSEPRYSEFTRADGSKGSMFQFEAAGDGTRARIVVWTPSSRPALSRGQTVMVTNLRSRRSTSGEFELHGDAGTCFVVRKGGVPVELRVAAVSEIPGGRLVIAVGRDKRVRAIEVKENGETPAVGEAVVVSADSEAAGRMMCTSPGSISKAEGDFPEFGALATKVVDARDENRQIMMEVIALSHGSAEDVRLRDGTAVKMGELVVGDDTGEARLVGWRELSSKVLGVQPGERLRITGVSPKPTKMGAWTLQVLAVTVIEKLRGGARS